MRKRIPLLATLSLAAMLFSSCAWVFAKPQPIQIPPGPKVATCPAKPVIHGTVSADGKSVVLTADGAQALIVWIHDYQVCTQSNEVEYKSYIEKLINRLKAVNGG